MGANNHRYIVDIQGTKTCLRQEARRGGIAACRFWPISPLQQRKSEALRALDNNPLSSVENMPQLRCGLLKKRLELRDLLGLDGMEREIVGAPRRHCHNCSASSGFGRTYCRTES